MTEPDQAVVVESFPGFDADDLGDFATEHCSVTLAEQLAGGPEHARERESPRGLAGMDE
ncbi:MULTISPECIES: hypothetical protein [Dactylosporangium]|uniref:Uncharacterized protein n=2 Tax=Dactylosporangium TaxID=35753 RepID=A0A9W6NNX1_9ACTN|nr:MULTISPECIES: hypothetical protein [Dactylosporangium]UAB96523.1 hypothetical protein Dvina_52935 [Dactylosporangium vinaceum]UWZ44842.1 hypothetical protein Dmats_47310 [Dactylosporangium matsuzakiense]GLL03688.1 hypothetical protein GCM10017581_054340 [Dactylosporangium matsuzakiense]